MGYSHIREIFFIKIETERDMMGKKEVHSARIRPFLVLYGDFIARFKSKLGERNYQERGYSRRLNATVTSPKLNDSLKIPSFLFLTGSQNSIFPGVRRISTKLKFVRPKISWSKRIS